VFKNVVLQEDPHVDYIHMFAVKVQLNVLLILMDGDGHHGKLKIVVL